MITLYDSEKFKSLVINGQFDAINLMIAQYGFIKMRDDLFELAYDTGSIAPYTFALDLVIKENKAENHMLASEILTLPLCHLTDAYRMGFFHARKALEMEPQNINYIEYLLFFHEIPDRLLSEEEAIIIAKEILLVDPENIAALRIFNRSVGLE